MTVSQIKGSVSSLLGTTVTSMERVYGGRNNRIYRLRCADSDDYAAKLFLGGEPDDRERLDTEFASLEFLWANGLDCVPRPVTLDRDQGYAIFEYIEGRPIDPSDIQGLDIDEAVRFLVMLKDLSHQECSMDLPRASDASFSTSEAFTSIESRLRHLKTAPERSPQYHALHSFLENDYAPALAEIRNWCESTVGSWGCSPASQLAQAERTLSPSDFGFHNSIRRPGGQVVFVDFEYFGWDDPAKMVSDFLLHPAMELNDSLKRRFVAGILSGFDGYRDLAKRLSVAYPIFGLKWCLIILNEFVPQKLSRRGFASDGQLDESQLQSQQLVKAQTMLENISQNYTQFPYEG